MCLHSRAYDPIVEQTRVGRSGPGTGRGRTLAVNGNEGAAMDDLDHHERTHRGRHRASGIRRRHRDPGRPDHGGGASRKPHVRCGAGDRRRGSSGHTRFRRHPHALRWAGVLGQAGHAVELAWRHDGRDGELRRRLRSGAPGEGRRSRAVNGERRGHPRHGAPRGHPVGLGEFWRLPRRDRHAVCRWTSERRCHTSLCGST